MLYKNQGFLSLKGEHCKLLSYSDSFCVLEVINQIPAKFNVTSLFAGISNGSSELGSEKE